MRMNRFIEKKNLWFACSGLIILLGFLMMGYRAVQSKPTLNYGIDFIGGSTLILKFDSLNQAIRDGKDTSSAFTQEVRSVLEPFGLKNSSIQIAQDGEVIIKTNHIEQSTITEVQQSLKSKLGNLEVLEIDYIGPTIGSELQAKSIWIVILVTVLLLVYVTFRFDVSYGIGVLAATLHDALIIVSVASIFYLEVNTEFVAAILTIIGYSINDTVVIFDRIRENAHKLKDGFSMTLLANESITQTLGRTMNTSIATLLVVFSLFFLGGVTIKSFCLILFVGIVVGTYSSIFIAAPVLVMTYRKTEPHE